MNATLLMNESDGIIGCGAGLRLMRDEMDPYNSINLNYHHQQHQHHQQQSQQQQQQTCLSDCVSTSGEKLNSLASSVSCSSPNDSTITGGYVSQSRYKISPSAYHELDSVNQSRTEGGDVDSAFPPKKLYTDDIPVLDSFPGFYGFDLYRPLCGDTYEASETKPSTAFFYFKDDQGWTNLFAKKTPCWWTLSYWCQRKPPDGAFIRLTPVYGASDKQQEVIQRCFEDFMAIPTAGMARYSIVMVGNSLAEYFFDPTTERLCVTLPYETPKEGCEYSQFNGKFMCFNSCLYNGGQGNKKPLFLIVTLERSLSGSEASKGHCEVLGRQCIKFRSCACPKRDKENNERRTGDPLSLRHPSSGKRKKDTIEHTDKPGKRLRNNTQRNSSLNMNYDTKEMQTQRTDSRWLSPRYDIMTDDNCADSQYPTESVDYTADSEYENGQTVINFNGETYNLLLVPTNLPGALETLTSVRLGLLRTWIHSVNKLNKQSPILSATDFIDATELKRVNRNSTATPTPPPPLPTTTTTAQTASGTATTIHTMKNGIQLSDRRIDIDSRYFNQMQLSNQQQYQQNQIRIGSALNQLNKDESHLAALLRERIHLMNVCQQGYQLSIESTDSQPNSTISASAHGYGSVTIDEPVAINGDYFHSNNILLNGDHNNNNNNNGGGTVEGIVAATTTSVITATSTTAASNNNSQHSHNLSLTNQIHTLNSVLTPAKNGLIAMAATTSAILTNTSTINTSTTTPSTTTSTNNNNNTTSNCYPGSGQMSWNYDLDQVMMMRNASTMPNEQLYNVMNDTIRVGELLESYTLIPHVSHSLTASSPNMHSNPMSGSTEQPVKSQQHHRHPQRQQQQRRQQQQGSTFTSPPTNAVSSTMAGLAVTTTTPVESSMNTKLSDANSSTQIHILVNNQFAHEFSSSPFYAAPYFNPHSPELEQTNLMETVSAGNNLNLCGYMNTHPPSALSLPRIHQVHQLHQQVQHTQLNALHHSQSQHQRQQRHHHPSNIVDGLLIQNVESEEAVNCLEKKNYFDEQDMLSSATMLSRRLHSPSFCTSSTHSPDSSCCEKLVKIES